MTRISEAELSVMKVLWRKSPRTARDVTEELADERDWTQTTVKTMLSRLVAKGAISHERDGRRFLYSPVVKRSEYLTDRSVGLVDRLFGGRAAPLVAHLAETGNLSEQDIAEIEKIIREIKS